MGDGRRIDDGKRSPFITPGEAAAFLRVEVSTLAAMRVSGTGPSYYKVGAKRRAKVLYRYEDLERWVETYKFSSTSEYIRQDR